MSLVDQHELYTKAYNEELGKIPEYIKNMISAKYKIYGIDPDKVSDMNYVEANAHKFKAVFANITNKDEIAASPESIINKIEELEKIVIKNYPILKEGNYKNHTISSNNHTISSNNKIQEGGEILTIVFLIVIPIVTPLFLAWRESVNCRQVASWNDRRSILKSLGVEGDKNIYSRKSRYVCTRTTESIGVFSNYGNITEYEEGFGRMKNDTPNQLKEVIAYVSLLDTEIFKRALRIKNAETNPIAEKFPTVQNKTISFPEIRKRQTELEINGDYKRLKIVKTRDIYESFGGKRKSRRNKKSKKSRKTRKSRKGKKSRRSKK